MCMSDSTLPWFIKTPTLPLRNHNQCGRRETKRPPDEETENSRLDPGHQLVALPNSPARGSDSAKNPSNQPLDAGLELGIKQQFRVQKASPRRIPLSPIFLSSLIWPSLSSWFLIFPEAQCSPRNPLHNLYAIWVKPEKSEEEKAAGTGTTKPSPFSLSKWAIFLHPQSHRILRGARVHMRCPTSKFLYNQKDFQPIPMSFFCRKKKLQRKKIINNLAASLCQVHRPWTLFRSGQEMETRSRGLHSGLTSPQEGFERGTGVQRRNSSSSIHSDHPVLLISIFVSV